MSSFKERLPSPALAHAVSCLWVQQIPESSDAYLHRSTPDGSMEITYRQGSVPILIGPRSRHGEETLPPGTTVVGVRFRPGAAVAFAGMPASELLDISVSLRDIWGPQADQLSDELADAGSPAMMVATLEREAHKVLAAAPAPDPVIQVVVDALTRNTADIGDLPTLADMSSRQLLRRSVAAVGYGPKALQRILRFQRLLASAHAGLADPLAVLAIELGYADQAHLTDESKRLTGLPPAAFLAEVKRSCDASHDHRASLTPWRSRGSEFRQKASRRLRDRAGELESRRRNASLPPKGFVR
jgi:AraC-like DNA-binding protein